MTEIYVLSDPQLFSVKGLHKITIRKGYKQGIIVSQQLQPINHAFAQIIMCNT